MTQLKRGAQGFKSFIEMPNVTDRLKTLLDTRSAAFITNTTVLVANNKLLQNCTPVSVMNAALMATTLELSLSPALGEAYVVPYKNRKQNVTEAQFQVGYKGLRTLAFRTNKVQKCVAKTVYTNQFISWDPFTEKLNYNAVEGKGEVVGYYAYFLSTHGFIKAEYWSKEKAIQHAQRYSQDYRSNYNRGKGMYYDNFDKMSEKNVLKSVLKESPMSIETQDAIKSDMAIMRNAENFDPSYLDNPQRREDVEVADPKELERDRVVNFLSNCPNIAALAQVKDAAERQGLKREYYGTMIRLAASLDELPDETVKEYGLLDELNLAKKQMTDL